MRAPGLALLAVDRRAFVRVEDRRRTTPHHTVHCLVSLMRAAKATNRCHTPLAVRRPTHCDPHAACSCLLACPLPGSSPPWDGDVSHRTGTSSSIPPLPRTLVPSDPRASPPAPTVSSLSLVGKGLVSTSTSASASASWPGCVSTRVFDAAIIRGVLFYAPCLVAWAVIGEAGLGSMPGRPFAAQRRLARIVRWRRSRHESRTWDRGWRAGPFGGAHARASVSETN